MVLIGETCINKMDCWETGEDNLTREIYSVLSMNYFCVSDFPSGNFEQSFESNTVRFPCLDWGLFWRSIVDYEKLA
jgi:hypothetical protein